MRLALALAILAGPITAEENWTLGPWCDASGWNVISIATHAVFVNPQTSCPLTAPILSSGVFSGELQCVVQVYVEETPSEPLEMETLVTLRLSPSDEGRLLVGFDSRAPEELTHCHAVWPL